MIPPAVPEMWRCPRRTGFLFPHPCERLTPVGCPDCRDGQLDDPYNQRRRDWGEESDVGLDDNSDYAGFGGGDSGDGGASSDWQDPTPDLTEADGESLVKPEDGGFESDMGAS